MKLDRVHIENFRSIESEIIPFDSNCRVLVGINESGKTNILHALTLLDPNRPILPDDVRLASSEENEPTKSEVKFVFKLTPEEISKVEEGIRSVCLFPTIDFPIVKGLTTLDGLTIRELCLISNEVFYAVTLRGAGNPRQYKMSSFADKYELVANLFRPSSACPADYALPEDSAARLLKDIVLIEESAIPASVPKDYIERANLSHLWGAWAPQQKKVAEGKHPQVLLWEYSPDFILPPRVNTEEFISGTNRPVPLKNMFELALYPDIAQEFARARAMTSSKGVANMLSRVAKRTTEHFRAVWKEYDSIEFSLVENGEHIDIGVKDARETGFNFEQRSDGFKRFVTFLLLVSVRFEMNKLTNTLILIDEPDIALHPSGSKYLRKELLKIAEVNYMVYSTHSIFMIDSKNINRHLIVKKKRETTTVEAVTPSTVREEEVVFNALGTSIFETLKESNILFEGWFDKKMFKTALTFMPSSYKKVGEQLRKIGFAHTTGVKSVESVTPAIEMAGKKLLIVSDCDSSAVQYQKMYLDSQGYGTWLKYDEIMPGTTALTGEDFLKSAAFKEALKEICVQYPQLIPIPEVDIDAAPNKLKYFSDWMIRGKVPPEDIKPVLKALKEKVFSGLKHTHLTPEYYELMRCILEKVEAL